MYYIEAEQEIQLGDSFPRKQIVLEEGGAILTADEASHLAFNVLPSYIEHMHETSAEFRRAADAIEAAPPAEPKPGFIDITPHPNGLRQMATVFDDQADAARKLARQLQGE